MQRIILGIAFSTFSVMAMNAEYPHIVRTLSGAEQNALENKVNHIVDTCMTQFRTPCNFMLYTLDQLNQDFLVFGYNSPESQFCQRIIIERIRPLSDRLLEKTSYEIDHELSETFSISSRDVGMQYDHLLESFGRIFAPETTEYQIFSRRVIEEKRKKIFDALTKI